MFGDIITMYDYLFLEGEYMFLPNAKKLICYVVVLVLTASLCPAGVWGAAAQDGAAQSEFESFYDKYGENAAYAFAGYTGDYTAATHGDVTSDLYAFNYLYTKVSNPSRTEFNGYIYTIDEAKKEFGDTDEGVVAAIEAGAQYFALKYDNSFRHEGAVTDANGVAKDAWFSTQFFRKDKMALAAGGISFGIKDESKITESDSGLTFVFEYLDNTTENISFQYINTSWEGNGFTGSSAGIVRGGTNTWKTGIITVDDAMFAKESDKRSTGLCSGREDFLFKGNDLYIASVMIIKNSEIKEYARATAKYTGGYDATEFDEEITDLYAFGYLYTKLYNNRYNFDGYIYTMDEAKKVFGENDEKVLAAQKNGYSYYAPQFDNSFRYEQSAADKNGNKKDAWYSTKYWRGDKGESRNGGIAFGIKDGSTIKDTDRELTFRIEYLDKGTDPIYIDYISSEWQGAGYVGSEAAIKRTGSDEWKTAYVSVTDAFFAPESDSRKTGLCSGKEDFIIRGNDLYVHSVSIVKTSLSSLISEKYDNFPATVYTHNDTVTGRTWYAMQLPGRRTYRSYVTAQSWNVYGTKFVVSDGSSLYEFDTLNHTYRFLDYGTTSSCYVSPENDIYYISGGYANKIDWDTYQKTELCEYPQEYNVLGTLSATSDGKYMSGYCTAKNNSAEQLVARLNTQTGKFDYIATKDFSYNENTMGVGHPILNPVYENLLFFCHEGTTTLIPDRLWAVDIDSGITQNIFKQSYKDDGLTAETSGHEAWNKDGEYLYFVKYTYASNKGQNGLVRVPFKNGKFTGEREYINGDAAYWHAYPSGDNNWVVADVNTGEVWIMGTRTHESHQIADFKLVGGARTDPHPHFSYASNAINWDIDFDGDTSKRGVAWADVSDITLAEEYNETRISTGTNTEAVSVTNTKSEVSTQSIDGKTFVKAPGGNNVYINIKDSFAKSVNQNVSVTFTAYSPSAANMSIGYTSPVVTDQDWHKYEDRSTTVAINKGTGEYTVDFGNININNINKFATDMFFASSLGDTYIADVKIQTYSDAYKTAPSRANAISATPMSFAGLCTFDTLSSMVHVDDTKGYTGMGITDSQAAAAKAEGYSYVSTDVDGAFMYKNVTDSDGITKNAWFTTKNKRCSSASYSDLGGYMYFAVTGDEITAEDNTLYLTVEYLDNRSDEFLIQYANSKGGTNFSQITVKPTNTGVWKAETFVIEDASISSATDPTAFLSGRADMRINANGKDLYVSRVSLEKPGSKYISNVASGITDGNVTYTLDAVNNSASDSSVKLYTAVYDGSGKLARASASNETKIASGAKAQLASSPVSINDGETAKVFVLSGNVVPYIVPENSMNVKVALSDTDTKITWDKYPYDSEVQYKVFCDGVQVGATYDTQFTYSAAADGAHSWHIEACDVYGRYLWYSINTSVTE